MSVTSPSSPPQVTAAHDVTAVGIDASCRLPLVVMFLAAGVWLLLASVFGLIASIKFHAPAFLADAAWLTYGRVHPVSTNALLYGFAVQAGLGVTLWVLARLGRVMLAAPWMVLVGALLWNLGVALGVTAILDGSSTGFEHLEFPSYAAALMFLGFVVVAFWALVTLHRRSQRELYVSQWFLLAALFWFPWIYSTANLLLGVFPVRGIAQAVIAWWFSQNLLIVWFGLVGLATLFYVVPRFTGRDLHSRYLALLSFWMLILFGSWAGVPGNAPVPAWMPSVSVVASVLGIVTVLSVFLNLWRTLDGKCLMFMSDPSLKFIGFGLVSFVVGGLAGAVVAFPAFNQVTQFTWFAVARALLQSYGFLATMLFAAIYAIVPRMLGRELPYPKLVTAHFFLAAAGVLLLVLPLAAGGIAQGLKLQQSNVAFLDIAKATLPFLRASTTGDLLLALGHLLFLLNLGALVLGYYRAQAMVAWVEANTELKTAEARG